MLSRANRDRLRHRGVDRPRAGWSSQYWPDADHISLANVDRFLDACGFFTLDIAVLAVEGRAVHFNFITRFTKNCDCVGKEKPLFPDLGVAASFDPVAADAAAMDLPDERHGADVFRELWPELDPRVQIAHGERIGLGTTRYDLVRVK